MEYYIIVRQLDRPYSAHGPYARLDDATLVANGMRLMLDMSHKIADTEHQWDTLIDVTVNVEEFGK